jgi:hypothetical protein
MATSKPHKKNPPTRVLPPRRRPSVRRLVLSGAPPRVRRHGVPSLVKSAVDAGAGAAAITDGPVFRTISKRGRVSVSLKSCA